MQPSKNSVVPGPAFWFPVLLSVLLLAGNAFADSIVEKDQEKEQSKFKSILDKVGEGSADWILTGTSATGTFGFLQSGTCEDPWQSTFGVGSMANSISVVILVSMALALLYMLGQFFQSPKILASVKDEFLQLGLMAVQLLSLIVLMQGANMWYTLQTTQFNAGGLANDPAALQLYTANPTIIDAAMAYSRRMIFEITSEISALALFNSVLHTLYSSTLWFGVTWRAMFSFNLGPELKPLIDIMGSTMQFLGIALGEWIFHLITLCLIKKWTWGIFVPMGMILYMVPHTRSAGAAIMALFISFSLIYPMMFVMNYEVYRLTSGSIVSGSSTVRQFFATSGLAKVGLIAAAAVFMMAGVLMPLFASAAISTIFDLIRTSIYYIIIISLLLPFLNIFVTLTAAREIARAFGANVNFLAFIQLI